MTTDDIPNAEQIVQILLDMRKNGEITVTHVDGTKCGHTPICNDAILRSKTK